MDVVRIPVYPHVAAYLKFYFGERMFVSDRNTISILVRSMLKKFDKMDPGLVRPSQKLNLGATFDIVIGKDGYKRLGAYMSNDDILEFSKAIDTMIRQEMFRWCNHPNSTDKVIDYNILRFRDLYGMSEDDFPFDNLKRWYFRERLRLKERQLQPVSFEVQLMIAL